jgi:hypothetical protein
VFTTNGRAAYVEVTVPDDYAPEAGVLTSFADIVKATDPKANSGRDISSTTESP